MSASKTVTVHAPVSVALSPAGTIQLNTAASVILTASTESSGVTYTWFDGTTSVGSNSNSLTVSMPGNYSVRIASGSCFAVSDVVRVVEAQSPIVTITAPAASSTFEAPASFVLRVQASDADGTITKVEFYQSNTKIGEATMQPYELSIAGLQTGSYTYYAVATDNGGLQTTSTNVLVTVSDKPIPPQVTLTAVYNESASGTNTGSIAVNVDISNTNGGDLTVEIYDGTTLLTTLTSAPYTYVYENPSLGSHNIIVKVSDASGNVVTQNQAVEVQPVSTSISTQNRLKVKCYPNPFSNTTYIELDGTCAYKIQDMLGREVESGAITYAGHIGSELASGQYIVLLLSGDKQSIVKIEKK